MLDELRPARCVAVPAPAAWRCWRRFGPLPEVANTLMAHARSKINLGGVALIVLGALCLLSMGFGALVIASVGSYIIDGRSPPAIERWKAANSERISFCRERQGCQRYRAAQQQCAVAGDLNNCVRIKSGGFLFGEEECTSDGELRFPPRDMPGPLACFFISANW